jgi:hypothetical protein
MEFMAIGPFMKSLGKRDVSLVPGSWLYRY